MSSAITSNNEANDFLTRALFRAFQKASGLEIKECLISVPEISSVNTYVTHCALTISSRIFVASIGFCTSKNVIDGSTPVTQLAEKMRDALQDDFQSAYKSMQANVEFDAFSKRHEEIQRRTSSSLMKLRIPLDMKGWVLVLDCLLTEC